MFLLLSGSVTNDSVKIQMALCSEYHNDLFIVVTHNYIKNKWIDTLLYERSFDCKMPLQSTVKPVGNDHLYNKIYYLWFIQ